MEESTSLICPKCGFHQPGGTECLRCGLIFAKYRPSPPPSTRPISEPPPPPPAAPLAAASWRSSPWLLVVAVAGLALVAIVVTVLNHRPADQADVADAAAASDPARAFRAYRDALASGDLDSLRDHVAGVRREEINGPDATAMVEMIRAFAPTSYEVTGVERDGDSAKLSLSATVDGQAATGTVTMAREEGRWLLVEEHWEVTLELGGELGVGESLAVISIERLVGGDATAAIDALSATMLGGGPPRFPIAFRAGRGHRPEPGAKLFGHSDTVDSIAFTPNGEYLVSASYGDMSLRLWRVADGAEVARKETPWRVEDLAVSPDGAVAYTVDVYNHLLAWPLEWESIGEPQQVALLDDRESQALAVAPGGRLVATAGGAPGPGGLALRDVTTGERLRHLETERFLRDLAFSADGRLLAAAGAGASFTLWDLARGEARRYTVQGPADDTEVFAVAFSPDGRLLTTAHQDSSISVWDVVRGVQIQDLYVQDASAMDAAFSADGALLATAQGDGNVYLWDPRTGVRMGVLRRHTGPVRAVAFSPDGTLLASASEDQSIILWR